MDGEQSIIVGKNIYVKVEEYLPDLILVSFKCQDKIFQGILLDSTKKQLPCGVYPSSIQSPEDPSLDKLFSLKQRHTYILKDGKDNATTDGSSLKKPILPAKTKSARMTVRLRPRQVLCSNCSSICNEKSENVSINRFPKSHVPNNRISNHTNNGSNQNDNSTFDKDIAGIDYSSNNNNSNRTNNNKFSINNNRKHKESRYGRETRQSIYSVNTSNTFKEPTTKVSSQTNNPVLVPRLIKLKASDIETATSVGISSLPSDNSSSKLIQSQASLSQCVLPENEDTVEVGEVKLPKLKLISGLQIKKSKGKIPKMTISTNVLQNGEGKECGIRTRSRGSVEDKADELLPNTGNKITIPKTLAATFKAPVDCTEMIDSDVTKVKKIAESTENPKESEEISQARITPNLPYVTAVESTDETGSYSLPKLTILPLNSKPTEPCDTKIKAEVKSDKMNLRKKRSVGSMEDLWDETVFDESKKLKSDANKDGTLASSEECDGSTDSEKPRTTPILKISFGPGKGTVLKIPAKSTVSENDSTESEEQTDTLKKNKTIISKAAKKALKRARKEAQKRGTGTSVFISHKSKFGGKSPVRLGGMSPARLSGFSPGRFGGTSPGRFGGASPGRFGGTSPGRFGGSSPSIFAGMMSPRTNRDGFFRSQSRKHKHKMKHKKRHKEDRKHKSDENVEPNNTPSEVLATKEDNGPLTEMTNMDIPVEKATATADVIWKVPSPPDLPLSDSSTNPEGNASPTKQNVLQNTRQKLSISIKRVSNASYVACDPSNQATSQSDGENPQSPPVGTPLSPPVGTPLSPLSPSSPLWSPSVKSDTSSSSPSSPCPATHHANTINTATTTTTSTSSSTPIVTSKVYEESDTSYPTVSNPEGVAEGGSDLNQSSDESGDTAVPDFPCIAGEFMDQGEDTALLLMKFGWHDVDSCDSLEGLIKVGDVVWGKINDLPWWPAKVTRLKMPKDSCRGQAQVCWYGSNASSFLPAECLQPYLKKFQMRYRKGRCGGYQDAVKEATFDADQIKHETEHPLNICESPITASPREVDVVS